MAQKIVLRSWRLCRWATLSSRRARLPSRREGAAGPRLRPGEAELVCS